MTDAQSLTRRANALVDRISTDPTASRWLRRALADALLRDIVDAANDAEILATVLRERADLYTTAAATCVECGTDGTTGITCYRCGS